MGRSSIYQEIYNEDYYTRTNCKNYDGPGYRIYHFIRYLVLGLVYKYFFGIKSILDIGCATGMSVWVFRKVLRLDAFGIDISEYAIASSIKSISKYVYCRDITEDKVDLPRSRFDMVVSYDMMEHLPPELVEKAVRNIFSITDTAVLGIYVLDEMVARIHNLTGLVHKAHFSEHTSAWWIDEFSRMGYAVTRLPFSRRGSLLVRAKKATHWR